MKETLKDAFGIVQQIVCLARKKPFCAEVQAFRAASMTVNSVG